MFDQRSILTLATLLAGYPKEQLDLSDMDGLNDVVRAVIQADDRMVGFQRAIEGRPDANDLREAIFALDPAMDFKDLEPDRKVVDLLDHKDVALMPDLPEKSRLTQDQINQGHQVAAWVNIYVDYACHRAPMLPVNFHEAAALWLLSVAVARRLRVSLPHDDIFPNLFILWVAPTTIYSKSTGLKIARAIAWEAIPHLLLSNEFSPEGLLDDLAGKPPTNLMELPDKARERWEKTKKYSSKRGLILDEASSLFAGFKRDFNSGLAEAIMRFYDCGNHDGRTRGRGLSVVSNSYMSFLGATTEISLQQADMGLWLSGVWPRFGLLIPTDKPKYRRYVTAPARPAVLVERLQTITEEWLPTPPNESESDYPDSRSVSMGSGVFEAWQRYDEAIFSILLSDSPPNPYLFGIYGRLPTQAIKIATCLAVSDWDGQGNVPTIDIGHWYRAQHIVEGWRAGAHQLYYALTGMAEDDSFERRVLRRVAKTGQRGIALRDLYRAERVKSDEMEIVINRLHREGLIEKFRPERSRTDHYKIP